jgi:hypothetical protein
MNHSWLYGWILIKISNYQLHLQKSNTKLQTLQKVPNMHLSSISKMHQAYVYLCNYDCIDREGPLANQKEMEKLSFTLTFLYSVSLSLQHLSGAA